MIAEAISVSAAGLSSRKELLLRIESLRSMTQARRKQILSRSLRKMEAARPLIVKIMDDIRINGDAALLKYTKQFDRVDISAGNLRLTGAEIRRAYRTVEKMEPALIPAMKTSLECITGYHTGEIKQMKYGIRFWDQDVRSSDWVSERMRLKVGQIKTPIARVGIYVPGGRAVLFTTALMAITPARVVGVPEIVVCSPPSRNGDIDPRIVVGADLAGATAIIRAGGAQAIAAMAYGTESVPKVFKIFGPGNTYVAAAKMYAASTGICAIDFLAGPSEILVIADDSANADWVARDLVSQAEHDADACAIFVTDSRRLAKSVQREIANVLQEGDGDAQKLCTVAKQSLAKYGAIIVVDSIDKAMEFSNDFAPEHLEIMTKNPKNWLKKVRNAGAIFLGKYSPVAVSDYVCPNHILPTGGAAKYTSGLNIEMFLKKPSTLKVPAEMAAILDPLIETLAKAEGLYNQHGLSVKARLKRRRLPQR